ncbi:hypothetical protein V5E97_00465 [Singulisphaera sp. Ch08]|uniref:DUF1778 domain-containing protein n=1 Tax=Singulisphaera sp. Ch08 TaxID=3120278 RepID=A0AAU7CH02_9BACT
MSERTRQRTRSQDRLLREAQIQPERSFNRYVNAMILATRNANLVDLAKFAVHKLTMAGQKPK